jgi:hypothetical protein
MGRHKNVENMSQEERIAHWARVREKDAADRAALIAQIEETKPEMIAAVRELTAIAADVAEDLQLYGVANVSVQQMHDLLDAAQQTRSLFNAGE